MRVYLKYILSPADRPSGGFPVLLRDEIERAIKNGREEKEEARAEKKAA